jgi:integrase
MGEYLDVVQAAVGDGARRAYRSYWQRIRDAWGTRRLDEPTPSEIKALMHQVRALAVSRCNGRGGRSAAELTLAALRCLYAHAVADNIISADANPAAKVRKPRRLPNARRAIPDDALAQIVHVGISTGNDPDLDGLILRLHIETACRRGGALALRRRDLDPHHSLIELHEKGDTFRQQPVSPTLMRALIDHADRRGGGRPDDQVLRYRTGKPITTRRYDHLWQRIGEHLPWVAHHRISTHWLRHTTLTAVERQFGFAVAQTYAGHTGAESVTTTYVRGRLDEVAAALSYLTGEPHPLARGSDTPSWILTAGDQSS